MKTISKISIIIIFLVLISLIFSNYSQASEIGNIFADADDFLDKGDSVGSVINETQLQETSDFMYKLLVAVGIIVMFIVGTIIGIQYMIASAEDKAKVKESLVPYIVGCFVIFGAFTIWSIVVNIGQDMIATGQKIYYEKDANIDDWCFSCNKKSVALCQIKGHRIGTLTKKCICLNCEAELSNEEVSANTCNSCGYSEK